jgi:hypothetical protein
MYRRRACKQTFNTTRGLLASALLAVVKNSRLNPNRFAIIYDNKYDDKNSGSTDVVEVPLSSSPPYLKPYHLCCIMHANEIICSCFIVCLRIEDFLIGSVS